MESSYLLKYDTESAVRLVVTGFAALLARKLAVALRSAATSNCRARLTKANVVIYAVAALSLLIAFKIVVKTWQRYQAIRAFRAEQEFFRSMKRLSLNQLPEEVQDFFDMQLEISKHFDSDYPTDFANDPAPPNCTLSSKYFNILQAKSPVKAPTPRPRAQAFTLVYPFDAQPNRTTVCSDAGNDVLLGTKGVDLQLGGEQWLNPVFERVDNFSASFQKRCASVNNSSSSSSRCPLIGGRRVLINYAGASCCRKSQYKNCLSGLKKGGFDVCVSFNERSIDAEFADKNCRIFRRRRGAGLWLWKPYVIYQTLLALKDGDYLFYADSGSEFIANIDSSLLCNQAELQQDIVVFSVGLPEQEFTKEEAFVLMDCTTKECRQSYQRLASFVMLRRSAKSLMFVSEWLTYAQDWRIISNQPTSFIESQMEDPRLFKGHRNDQSILSLLSKKWNLDVWPDPSNYGNKPNDTASTMLKSLPRFRFMKNKHFILHTRSKA